MPSHEFTAPRDTFHGPGFSSMRRKTEHTRKYAPNTHGVIKSGVSGNVGSLQIRFRDSGLCAV